MTEVTGLTVQQDATWLLLCITREETWPRYAKDLANSSSRGGKAEYGLDMGHGRPSTCPGLGK